MSQSIHEPGDEVTEPRRHIFSCREGLKPCRCIELYPPLPPVVERGE